MSSSGFKNVGSFFRDCNGTTLRYDQACLKIITREEIDFWSQTVDCIGCQYWKIGVVSSDSDRQFVVPTLNTVRYAFTNYSVEFCEDTYYKFDEFGQYSLNLSASHQECLPKMTAQPDAPYLPIISAAVILLSMATLWYVIKVIGKRVIAGQLYGRYFAREDNELGSETRVLTTESSIPRTGTRSRLRSLDIFRGITIALMIFVNAGGGGYDVFAHSTWNGLTIADVVFPWFAFAMGEAMQLSLKAALATSMSRKYILAQVSRRALFLALIGITLGSVNANWQTVRLPGVLQRLAAMYLVVGALEALFMKSSQDIVPGRSLFRDISAGWPQWLATILIASVHVCVSLLLTVPGCPRGYMGPGGLHMSLPEYGQKLHNCTGGAAGYIDRELFGPSHLYQRGTFKEVYHTTEPHDPEGLLGVLSGILVVQAGVHAGRIMSCYNHARARIMRWLLWSLIFGITGGALCQFSKEGGPIPINKNLWSVSYCLVTASMAFFIKAFLYFVVDLKNRWGGRPFYYAGQNALFLYIGSELLKKHFPFYIQFASPTHTQLLMTHAASTLMWGAIAVALHRKRIFITI